MDRSVKWTIAIVGILVAAFVGFRLLFGEKNGVPGTRDPDLVGGWVLASPEGERGFFQRFDLKADGTGTEEFIKDFARTLTWGTSNGHLIRSRLAPGDIVIRTSEVYLLSDDHKRLSLTRSAESGQSTATYLRAKKP